MKLRGISDDPHPLQVENEIKELEVAGVPRSGIFVGGKLSRNVKRVNSRRGHYADSIFVNCCSHCCLFQISVRATIVRYLSVLVHLTS